MDMIYRVTWGDEPNTGNGDYNLEEVVSILEDFECDVHAEWEEEMWTYLGGIGRYVVKLVKLQVGESVRIPYASTECLLPEILEIKRIQ